MASSIHGGPSETWLSVADAVGHVGVAIHWTSNSYQSEELPFDIANSVSSEQLRAESLAPINTDLFYWVQGCTSHESAEP